MQLISCERGTMGRAGREIEECEHARKLKHNFKLRLPQSDLNMAEKERAIE